MKMVSATLASNTCVAEGSFAGGALSRWRTLHELNTIAALLTKNDKEFALRYLVSFELQALMAARQMKKYADRSKMEPPSDDEIAAIEARCKANLNQFGEDNRHEYGWASRVIGTAESKSPVLLAGQSNSGTVDPLHMTAVTLTNITVSLLLSRPNTDRLVCTKVLMGLSDDVGSEALKVDRAPPPNTPKDWL
jgi:hypothetical protein